MSVAVQQNVSCSKVPLRRRRRRRRREREREREREKERERVCEYNTIRTCTIDDLYQN